MNLTQVGIELLIERLVNQVADQEQRIARLERSLCVSSVPPSPLGPSKFKHIDIIPIVDDGD